MSVWLVQGAITTIYVKVPYTGIMETTAETFAKCRAEVRRYVEKFANWPSGIALMQRPSGCPQISFSAPYEFIKRSSVCDLHQ